MLGDLLEYARTGLEINPNVLAFARSRYPDVSWIEGSVSALPFRDAEFEAVVSLDVLCCSGVESDLDAAREIRRVLRDGGTAVFNLPAYAWLKSAHDVVANSARRYTASGTRGLLREAGFSAADVSYRVSTLLPLAAGRRMATRNADARTDVGPVPNALNQAFTFVNRAENRLARRRIRAPFGLSVFATATR
jgi:ubiquinone/menaquinone biosynthesis C-methylase UbiE